MKTAVLTLQSKGQIMLPKEWRDELGVKVYQAVLTDDTIVLRPVEIASDKKVKKAATKVMKQYSTLFKSLAKK